MVRRTRRNCFVIGVRLALGCLVLSPLFSIRLFHQTMNDRTTPITAARHIGPTDRDEEYVLPNGAFVLNKETVESHIRYFDPFLCQALEELFQGTDVVDLGAGIGLYGHCMMHNKQQRTYPEEFGIDDLFYNRRIVNKNLTEWWKTSKRRIKSWTGFDGASHVEKATNGFVKYMDLSRPQSFDGTKWDWVMSLEVGEHIAPEFESVFIDNVVTAAKNNIVLSWATIDQGGQAHVNPLPNTEVIKRFVEKGFYLTGDFMALRKKARLFYFNNTLMSFRRGPVG